MRRNWISTLILGSVVLWGCAPAEETAEPAADTADTSTADASSDLEAAREFANSWDAAVSQEDADLMASMFTEDGARLLEDVPILRGRAAIREQFAQFFESTTSEAEDSPGEITMAGDFSWNWGSFSETLTDKSTGDAVTYSGKYVNILRKTDEGWKFATDATNRDEPGEPGKPRSALSLPPEEDRTLGDPAEVAAVRYEIGAWVEATKTGDIDSLVDRFSENGMRMNDSAPTDVGHDAIRATYAASTIDTQDAQLTFDMIEVSGEWAWARGHWGTTGVSAEGQQIHDQGKWISILKKGSNGWKTEVNLWNHDAPPFAPGP